MLPVLVEGISSLVMGLIHKFLPDTTQEAKDRLAAALQAELIQSNIDVAQIQANAVEGANESVFVSGWRPFIGWVCGLAFAWQYLGLPILTFLSSATGHPLPPIPHLDTGEMMPVLMGLLGLGGLRTYEKLNK